MASKLIPADSFIGRSFRKSLFKYKVPSRIHRAACLGDVRKVKHILARGEAGVDERDKKNRTPLHYASAFGHPELVALLINKKCNLELFDNYFNTALNKAVEHQHEECVEILLNNGANPNVQDIDGYSSLHYAIFCQTTAIAENLLSHNASMELQNKDGHTPLLLALKHNKQQVAELLIQKKANIHMVDEENRTALMLAAKHEAKHIIELLLHGGIDAFAEDQSGNNALSYAISSGFNVKIILEHTRAEFKNMQTRKVEGDNSLTRSAMKHGPGDIKPTSEEDNNKSDTKNVPESKGEICGEFQQSKKEVSKKKCSQDGPAFEETNKANKVVEVNTVRTFKSDENSKNETSISKSGPVEARPTSNGGDNKSDTKNVPDSKNVHEVEVCENFPQSRNDAKCVSKRQENRALHDNNNSESEAEHVVSALHARHIKVKTLHETSLSSLDPNNVCEGELCENSWQFRNDAKCVSKRGEDRALYDNNNSESEVEHMVSALRARHIKVKSLYGTPPSSSSSSSSFSPDKNNVCEGNGEVCGNFQQSRNDVKCNPGNPKHGALLDKNISKSKIEHMASSTSVSHIKEESFRDVTLSSPVSKSVSESLPLRYVGKFTVAEDQRAEQKINKDTEDDLGTSSHMSGSRTPNNSTR